MTSILPLSLALSLQGVDMGEAKKIALRMAHETGLTYINGYDHPHIMAGQGTIGLEIAEQVSDVDAVVIPVGGGGLIAGIATAIKNLSPQTKIIVSLPFAHLLPPDTVVKDGEQGGRHERCFCPAVGTVGGGFQWKSVFEAKRLST